jgi:hypothetical protein
MAEESAPEKPTKYLFRLTDLKSPDLQDRIRDFLDQVVPKTVGSEQANAEEDKKQS